MRRSTSPLERGEITALLGAGGVLGTGVVNPRYVFLPISPAVPAARAFSDALGAKHVNSLDVHAYGMELDCHIVDFGPSGLLGFQRDWIYRETGVVPPVDSTEVDPGRLIRLLRDPNGLSHGPEWLGSTPSERLYNLRRKVRDALSVFGDHRDDEMRASDHRGGVPRRWCIARDHRTAIPSQPIRLLPSSAVGHGPARCRIRGARLRLNVACREVRLRRFFRNHACSFCGQRPILVPCSPIWTTASRSNPDRPTTYSATSAPSGGCCIRSS